MNGFDAGFVTTVLRDLLPLDLSHFLAFPHVPLVATSFPLRLPHN